MKPDTIRSLAASVAVLLSLPAAAQYKGFNAAITKQISPINAGDPAIVELLTVIPMPYVLQFESLAAPNGVALKDANAETTCPDARDARKCRQRFTMAVDAHSSGKCSLNGNYVAKFDVACTDPKNPSCKPGKHEVAFSLQSENFCTAKVVDTSRLWQQVKGVFAGDVGVGGASLMWFLDANKNVPGGFDVVSMDLNKTAGMRRNGGAVRIDVDGKGNAFVANDKGEMFRFNGNGWNKLPGLAKDIGVGANGVAWHIGTNAVAGGFGIYRWNGNGWDDTKGGAVRVDVDPQGNAWVVTSDGDVFRFTGNGWAGVPGIKARDVGVGANGAVFVAGQDGSAYKWDGKAWINRGGSGVTDISVTADGAPVAVINTHELWIGQPR